MTLINQEENKEGKIINILGKDKPYLNIEDDKEQTHTKEKIIKYSIHPIKKKQKRQYKLDADINNLIEDKKVNHITYAGYGFSGSGKTYTLIEGSPKYRSVISQLVNILTNKEKEKSEEIKKIDIYEYYVKYMMTNVIQVLLDHLTKGDLKK